MFTALTLADRFMNEDDKNDKNDKDFDPMSESEDGSELSRSKINPGEVDAVSHQEKNLMLSETRKDIEQVLASALEAKKTYIKQIQHLKSYPAGVELIATESEILDQFTKKLDLVEKSLENITNQEHNGASSQ
ncbi:hypothetical protein A0J61_10487 [Choanephora cucurbitarum]|uniref:Uncharacterized protein n=1 Tax=Choanephora cucurbitarum TaxID=101091 RepID=A0A1C7MXC4_9FUNG|nr:hypothetical protein A0J61_10487 [Choanephora cucurbitarum]